MNKKQQEELDKERERLVDEAIRIREQQRIHDPIVLVKEQSRDADAWARMFCENTGFEDIDLARAWFANAMMAMHDSIFNNEYEQLEEKTKVLVDALERIKSTDPGCSGGSKTIDDCDSFVSIATKALREYEGEE